jgi:hypothetical protein
MPAPLRLQILDAVEAALKLISTGAGYHTSPVVTRVWLTPEQHSTFPVLTVTEGSGSTFVPRAAGRVYEHGFVVAIHGYVKANDGKLRGQWLEELHADVVACLLASEDLGGLVRQMEFGALDTDEGFWEPIGAFIQDVTVRATEVF